MDHGEAPLEASRPALLAFSFAALNSGVSTSLRIDSMVGRPLFVSLLLCKPAFSISFSPSSKDHPDTFCLVFGQLEPFGKR